ncbi:uroporphyrinogen-III C-methyltransferase [Bacillus sp. 03113]|uniref:uroporphyrinogen-III C-methyltransferase n=1 Tax=Bacillus sp. 03113 TaxID=2578211 RepID=UPI001142376D|nr:uroporphyrinogen-III C-methyltransferase [Bacillus sp. 03113]
MSIVYLVGAGPGDPDLITLKGLKCIQEADVLLYDRLVNKELLSHAKPNAELIYCGKLPDYHTLQQETINEVLIKHAKKGQVVTRLKGGDPFVFGRGGEEAEALAKYGIPFEIIPGITSGIAAPAYAGIPVTHRDYSSSFAIVTGHCKNDEKDQIKWESLAKGIDTIAIYMGVSNLPYIQEKLLYYGKSPHTPVALINWGTMQEQRTLVSTLEDVARDAQHHKVENPCMILIGDVVKLREKIKWFEGSEINQALLSNGVL